MASHKVFVQGHGDYRINLNRGVSGTVHVLKPKEHTDVTVYVSGLFQEDRFVAVSALAIQSIFNTLVKQQTIAGTDSIGLTSSIGDITNIVEITLASLIGLNSSASLSKSMDYSGAAEVGLRSDIDGVIGNLISGADNLGISFAVGLLTVGVEFDAESEFGILSVLDTLLKAAYFEAAEQLGLEGAAHFIKALLFPATQADIGLASMIDGQIAKYIDAADNIGIISSMNVTSAYKMIEASSVFTISPILSSLIKEATFSADNSFGIVSNGTVTSGQIFDGDSVLALRAVIGAVVQSCIDAIDELGIDANMSTEVRRFLQAASAIGIDAEISEFVSKADIQAGSSMSIDGDVSIGYTLIYSGQSSFALDGAVSLNSAIPIDGESDIGVGVETGSLLANKYYSGSAEFGLLANTVVYIKDILADMDDSGIGAVGTVGFVQSDSFTASGDISFTVDASADFSKALVRLRLLSDMDEFNLSDFDDMTLGELTYIEIKD